MTSACDPGAPPRPPAPIIGDIDRALWITRTGDYVLLTYGDATTRQVYAPLVTPARETSVQDLLDLLPR